MKWDRLGPEAVRCGEWIISRTRHGDKELYTLWRGSERMNSYDTAKQAKAAAQERKT